MRNLAFAAASVFLLTGTSAAAQEISNINASAGSSYYTPGIECVSAFCTRENPLPGGEGRFPGADVGGTGGANYSSFVDISGNAITFESSNAVSQGPFTSFSSYSTVSFDFFNDNPYEPVNFHSEITPQGLGLYLADTSGGCLFTSSCAQVSDQLYTFGDLAAAQSGTSFLGGAGFQFGIYDNGQELLVLSGLLLLQDNPDCPGGYCILTTLYDTTETMSGSYPSAADFLNGFSQQTDPFDLSARAFGWGSTGVDFALGGGLHQIEYRTAAVSFTSAPCIGPTENICLLAYSGFGDPIGRGGGIDALATLGDVESYTHLDGDLIGGLNFTPETFNLRFRNGELIYDGGGAVPEPGTWALMIAGFGLLGAALRRRHIPAHI